MDLVLLGLGITGVVATLAGSWVVGGSMRTKAALAEAEIIIGMLSTKVGLLQDRIRELEDPHG